MLLIKLTLQSVWNRRLPFCLTVLSIALSVCLFLVVQRTRVAAKESFSNTISQTDLIVGGRTGSIQLLLYSVFHLGNATNNISYSTYEKFAHHPATQWTIPISLGDSHRGRRVVATQTSFFEHYRYAGDQSLSFLEGKPFERLFDVVLGNEVARSLNYGVGSKIALAHGISETGVTIQDHADKPFHVVGVLKPTGTPLDKSLFISLVAMEALHVDWADGGAPVAGQEAKVSDLESNPPEVKTITSFFLRTKSRIQTLSLQREVNTFEEEALLGIIPGVALSELWNTVAYAEMALQAVSLCVVVVGMVGMLLSVYTSLQERRREIAIFRAIGMGSKSIYALIVGESFLIAFLGTVCGFLLSFFLIFTLKAWIAEQFGLQMPLGIPTTEEWLYLMGLVLFGGVLGFLPAWRAYRNSLVDGLAPKT
jgi:putative ABC transport system permease protein